MMEGPVSSLKVAPPRRSPGPGGPELPAWQRRFPLWFGTALQVLAALMLVGVVPAVHATWAGRHLWPLIVYTRIFAFASGPTVLNAILLFVIGAGVKRRKRAFLWIVIVLQIPTVVLACYVGTSLLLGDNPYSLRGHEAHLLWPVFGIPVFVDGVLSIALIVAMVLCRGAFPTRLPSGSWRGPLAIVGASLAVSFGIGGLLIDLFPGTLATPSDRVVWLVNTTLGTVPNQILLDNVRSRPLHWVVLTTTSISAIGFVLALIVFTRSSRTRRVMTEDDEFAVRRLLAEYGSGDSLGYFATRRDKAVVFSADRQAAIAYNVFAGVALATGDPIGDPRHWPEAIRTWTSYVQGFGWAPAVLGTTEAGARAFAAAGLRTTIIGDEAVIDVGRFTADASRMAGVRASARHARHQSYTVRVRRQSDVPPDELARLVQLADTWRDGAEERGFSMALSRFGDPADTHSVVVVAHDAGGRPRGLLVLVPWGPDGLSLDVMRRAADAANGVTELMVCALVDAAGEIGLRRFSLNFAMFREAFERGEHVGASRQDRFKRRVLLVLSRWWQLDSLYRSNRKYLPAWQPRLLCYDRGISLARVMVAAGLAEGFLRGPSNRLRRLSRAGGPASGTRQRPAGFAERVRRAEEEVLERSRQVAPRYSDQERVRRDHLRALTTAGREGYPVTVPRTSTIAQVRHDHDGLAADRRTGTTVSLTGRVVARRRHGRITFLDLREADRDLQVVADAGRTAGYATLTRALDTGDLVSVTGEVFTTRTGELSVAADSWVLAGKSLQPVPGRTARVGAEVRLRKPYLDMALRPDAARMLRVRATALRSLRRTLDDHGFMEVQTPVLQTVHGGANARPFTTHINAYDEDLYLRIAPELALKQLVVGGAQRIYEMGPNFRNEGVDARHNPEFTSVEAYQAYADYTDMRTLTEDVIVRMARAVHGEPVVIGPSGERHELPDRGWPAVTVCDAVGAAVGEPVGLATPPDRLRELCRRAGAEPAGDATAGELIQELYDRLVEPRTVLPTFYLDFPVDGSPLTRRHRSEPGLAERWDLVAFGVELGTGYSELTDPVDQRARLTAQSLRAAHGDPEAMEVDEAFLGALEFGMPPTGGLGLGVDRLIMLVSGATMQQTLSFPFVRPRAR